MAVYPLAVYFDGELLIANLLVFLLLLGFWLLGRARDRDRQWYLPGLAFGLAAIARPNVLAVITVLAVWLLWTRVRRWTRVAQFLAAAAIVIAPVTIRNYVKSQRFVLIAWQGGTNFYIGNNPNSDGITAVVPGTRESWWGGYNDVKRLAEQNLGRELKGSEIDAYWLQQGFKFWREQPLAALKLLARKTYLWLSGYEVSNNRDIYFFKRFTFLNLLLFQTPALKFPFGLALPFALLGIWYSRKRWRELLPEFLFLAAFSASFIIFFVTARYRMPVVVLLIPFAVHGIMRLFRTSGRGLTAALVPLVLGFVLFNFNFAGIGTPNMAQNFFIAAKGLHDSGDRTAAGEMLVQALKRDSASNILSLEVTMAMEQGHYDRAQRAARAALRLWPTRADGWGIAGNVAATMGQLDTAEVYFRKAIELDPYSVQALNNLGNIATQRNDYPQARRYYDQALAIDPNFTTALFQLGYLDYREGNKPKAHELWQRVLQLEPGNAKARQALQQLR
jgi:tetratricopeptide (TPR) repeat protein